MQTSLAKSPESESKARRKNVFKDLHKERQNDKNQIVHRRRESKLVSTNKSPQN